MEGRTLSHYRIVEQIGAGGMGVVYRAHDERLDRDVALKVLPPGLLSDDAARRHFRREALALSKLSHPNIATVHDFDTQEGVDFLVMEFVPGQTLAEKLAGGALPERDVAALGAQIASALEEAHEQGVVHRDLKPGNILVTPRGHAKVLDFGLAMLLRPSGEPLQSETRSQAHAAVGTLPYMAPEQLIGEKVDARSDIYAAGAVFFEMATRQRPFPQESAPQLIDAIQHESPPTPSATNRRLSPALDHIILKALDKDPRRRYQSAGDLRVDLERLGAPAPLRAARRPRAHAFWWAIAPTGVLLALVGVIVGLNMGGMRERFLGRAAPQRIESLAVLPLTNLSGDPEQEYFADGMTEELITDLAKIGALRVISRTSAMHFKGTDKPVPEIARQLNVDAIIEGSVMRSNDRVRITAQLIEGATDRHLWAESYERNLSDILALQREVARAIASAIAVRLSPEESARLGTLRTMDPRALDAYLRGRALWNQRTEAAVREGLEHFETATQIAPEFALAFAGLADSYIILGVYGFEPPRLAFPAAKIAAQHAIELDPTAGEPHASLGDIHFHYDWDWEASDREHRRAIELSPGFATAYHWRSETLLLTGHANDAIEALQRARSLDPLSMTIRASLAWTLSLTGDREGAIAELREAVTLDPRFPRTRGELARQLLSAGRSEEALAEARRLVEANPDDFPGQATLGLCLGATGRVAEAREILGKLDRESGRRFVPSLDRARITAGLRDREGTLRYLEDAVLAREGFLPFLPMSDEFGFLHGDARYTAILMQIGIPEKDRSSR